MGEPLLCLLLSLSSKLLLLLLLQTAKASAVTGSTIPRVLLLDDQDNTNTFPIQHEADGHQPLRELQQQLKLNQHWDQNYSCIFDNTNSFSYLHVGYVYYFNITNRESFQASIDVCLDTCTRDCSCSVVVYNVDTECCYEFHEYIPVQTLPFNPVEKGDSLSVYLKVERGNSGGSKSRYLIKKLGLWLSMVVAAALVS